MTWFGTFLLVWWALNALLYVLLIDRAITFSRTGAVVAIGMYVFMAWALLTVGTGT